MVPKGWLLVFTSVAVLALVVLYIRHSGPEPQRPLAQLQMPSSTPDVAPPLPYGTLKPPPRTTKPVVVTGNASFMLVRRVLPRYTKAARNAHYEGEVTVNFILGRDGVAHGIRIVNSPGYGMDQNIIEAMKQWLWDSVFFHEDQKVTLTFVFKLDH